MHAKQGNQQGRRTPLSLNAAGGAKHHHDQHQQQQQHQHHQQSHHQKNKAGAANGSGSNTMSAKHENKSSAQHKTEPTLAELKKQHLLEKKQQQQQQHQSNDNSKKSVEKNEEKRSQNGNSTKNNTNAKEKHQTENGNEHLGSSELLKDRKDKPEKEKEKVVEKNEKLEKNDKIHKVSKEDKKEKINENSENEAEKKAEDEKQEKTKNDIEQIDMDNKESNANRAESEIMPSAKSSNEKEKKIVTPTKSAEKPQKTTPIIEKTEKVATPTAAPVVLTSIDVDMEPIKLDKSPIKYTPLDTVVANNAIPSATSTPGKALVSAKRSTNAKSDIQLAIQAGGGSSPDRSNCPRTFTQISGRRSIRPLSEFAPTQYRESYRRINTELDVTSTTNTSLNVTVGSEVPNNSSFSFFGRGRKRDRTPPLQSAMELQHDVEVSPPKRVRLDIHGFFSAVSSPLTLLRSRFSKTSIQSSTPVKLSSKLTAEDEGEVQNVSGISIHEEMPTAVSEADEITATEDITVGNKSGNADEVMIKAAAVEKNESTTTEEQIDVKYDLEKSTTSIDAVDADDGSDIKITETPIVAGDSLAKKRCHIM